MSLLGTRTLGDFQGLVLEIFKAAIDVEMSKMPVVRRLGAILAADIAGYSRLMGADEEGTLTSATPWCAPSASRTVGIWPSSALQMWR